MTVPPVIVQPTIRWPLCVEGAEPPPWLPWVVLVIALATSGLALRALACAS